MNKSPIWSEKDIELLKEKYATSTNEQLKELFPNRSFLGIYKKAYRLGLHHLSEIEFENRSFSRKGEKGSNWHGGYSITKKGYKMVLKPDHPRADRGGYVMEHIVVFEEATGLKIPLGCDVQHLNGDKTDNRIENLCVMSHSGHATYHNLQRSKEKKYVGE